MSYFKRQEERMEDVKVEILNILNKEIEMVDLVPHFPNKPFEFEIYFQKNALEIIIECRNDGNLEFVILINNNSCKVSTHKILFDRKQMLQIYDIGEKIQHYLQNHIREVRINSSTIMFSEDNFKTCKTTPLSEEYND